MKYPITIVSLVSMKCLFMVLFKASLSSATFHCARRVGSLRYLDHSLNLGSSNIRSTYIISSPLWNSKAESGLYNDESDKLDDSNINYYQDSQMELGANVASYSPPEADIEQGKLNPRRLVNCKASIMLPFSADVAFDAFSDLTRHPSWCKYLHSVEYLSLNNEIMNEGDRDINSIDRPLRQSKWTARVKGLSFSWTATDTLIVRPYRIEWESTSGMKNKGSVEFSPQMSHDEKSSTSMTLCFTFITPRIVSSIFQRLSIIREYTEDILLMNMLTEFRDAVMREDY